MSLESLGCLESLVPSKPSEPTLTSNQRLRLHHSTFSIGTDNWHWQHWILATFPKPSYGKATSTVKNRNAELPPSGT